MCLSVLYKEIPKNLRKENGYNVGWKVFYKKSKRGKRLYTYLMGLNKPLPINKWIHEKKWRDNDKKEWIYVSLRSNKKYKTGFHIYRYKKDAMKIIDIGYEVHKVYFKDIVVYGSQWRGYIIVAKEIYIPDEEK